MNKGYRSIVDVIGTPPTLIRIDNVLYDANTTEVSATFPADLPKGTTAVSPSGKKLAVAVGSSTNRSAEIHVFTAGTADDPAPQPMILRNTPDQQVHPELNALFFRDDDNVAALTKRDRDDVLVTWNLDSGQERRPILMNVTGSVATALSSDRKYLAVGDWDGTRVYNLTNGRVAATMGNPADANVSFHPDGLAFSHDTAELAAFANDRLVVWSARGDVVLDHTFAEDLGAFAYRGRMISWMPDGQGWLLAGHSLILRDGMVQAWKVNSPTFYDDISNCILDAEHCLVGQGGTRTGEFVAMPIPWDRINEAVEAVNPSGNALLAPGKSVSLNVKVGQVRFGNPQEVSQGVFQALSRRIQQANLVVAQDAPVRVEVSWTEAAGKQRGVRDSPFAIGASGSTRMVTDTEITCEIQMFADGQPAPIWSDRFSTTAGLIIDGEINEQSIRKDAWESATHRLQMLKIPTRIGNDPNQRLPIETNLRGR